MRGSFWSPFSTGSLGLVLLLGCSDPLKPEDVVRVYQATEFTILLNGAGTNLLASGASVTLELKSDGSTGGHFVLPLIPGVTIVAVDDDLTGSFILRNDVVRLEQAADTYIKDFFFVAADNQLRASQVINDGNKTGNLRLVLTRQ